MSCCRVLSSGSRVGAAAEGEPLKVYIITETRGHPVNSHHILGVYRDVARAHGDMKKQFQKRVLEWAKKEQVQTSEQKDGKRMTLRGYHEYINTRDKSVFELKEAEVL